MSATYPARAARPPAHSAATYFTQDSHSLTNSTFFALSNTGRYTSEMSAMSYKKPNSRARYASVLYAAALAALLAGCAKTDVAVETAPKAATIHLSESSTADAADMQEVVVSASRERPKAIG
jgi:uncharacterized lipoprotein YajG